MARPEDAAPPAAYVLMLVCMYATCSSTLSIVNKWALLYLPFPGLVTACQFATTAAFVWAAGSIAARDRILTMPRRASRTAAFDSCNAERNRWRERIPL